MAQHGVTMPEPKPNGQLPSPPPMPTDQQRAQLEAAATACGLHVAVVPPGGIGISRMGGASV